jgi:hypothetical protein
VTRNVLVIAADGALRRSLVFLFEAEGLDVSSIAYFAPGLCPTARRSRCLVVDESALASGCVDPALLGTVADPVVVLSSRALDLPPDRPVCTVQKPPMGAELVETVRMLLVGQDDPT